MRQSRQRVLAFSCYHAPFQHPGALDFLREVAGAVRPMRVVCLGDEIDAHRLSRFVPDPDSPGAGDEFDEAVDALRPLYELFPKVMVCRSNHTDRIYRAAARAGLPSRVMRTERQILEAPRGWVWHDDWVLDGVRYMHGDGFSGINAPYFAYQRLRQSVVMGHVHTCADVRWSQGRNDRVFGMCVGCLADPDSLGMRYAKHILSRPILGCGVIEDGVPRFVPMVSNA